MKLLKEVRSKKQKLTPQDLCSSRRASILLEFVKHVFQIDFKDKPDYGMLKTLLSCIILEGNVSRPSDKNDKIGRLQPTLSHFFLM